MNNHISSRPETTQSTNANKEPFPPELPTLYDVENQIHIG